MCHYYVLYFCSNTFSQIHTVYFTVWKHDQSCSPIQCFHRLVLYISWIKSHLHDRACTNLISNTMRASTTMKNTYIADQLQQFICCCLWQVMPWWKWVYFKWWSGDCSCCSLHTNPIFIWQNSFWLFLIRNCVMAANILNDLHCCFFQSRG